MTTQAGTDKIWQAVGPIKRLIKAQYHEQIKTHVTAQRLPEVHRSSADNQYRPFDNRHQPIIDIGRLFVLVSKQQKMLLTAVHIDDNEVTNDSVISHVSSSTFNRTK